MTGYRKINLTDWIRKGEGATAESYFHKTDKTIMLKLFTGEATLNNYAQREYDFANNVYKLGIKTPKALEVVEADGKLGVIYERVIGKKSFSKICHDNPNKIDEYSRLFARELKKLNALPCDTKSFPSINNIARRVISSNRYFRKKTKTSLLKILEDIEDRNTCLHGDPHSGNLLESPKGLFWIDLGAFCFGNPIYDEASVYFFYRFKIGKQLSKKILHMNSKQLNHYWLSFINEYSGVDYHDKKSFKLYLRKMHKAVLIFALYTCEVEHYAGFKAWLASFVIKILNWQIRY